VHEVWWTVVDDRVPGPEPARELLHEGTAGERIRIEMLPKGVRSGADEWLPIMVITAYASGDITVSLGHKRK
jgi:hypothetical protein